MYTSQDIIKISVPLTPPTVNHYKKPVKIRTRNGVVSGWALTDEAIGFKNAIAMFSGGQTLIPKTEAERKAVRYVLEAKVFQGLQPLRVREKKQRTEQGDGDNYWKCIADGLVDAGVIHNDRRVRIWRMEVDESDRENPRTEVTARIYRGHLPIADDASRAIRAIELATRMAEMLNEEHSQDVRTAAISILNLQPGIERGK